MRRTKREILTTALFHLDKVEQQAAHGLTEELVIDACALRLIALLDSLSGLPHTSLTALFPENWALMRGMRNRLVHGYATVDTSVIEVTIREELPHLRRVIERELALDN